MFFAKEYFLYRHSKKAMLVIDKCWMHIGTKLILRYSEIYVEQYYEFIKNCIGFDLKDFDVFMYKVLILLKTKNKLIVYLYKK